MTPNQKHESENNRILPVSFLNLNDTEPTHDILESDFELTLLVGEYT